MRRLQRIEAVAFLLFVAFGAVGAYEAFLGMGLSDGIAGSLAGAGVGLTAIAWAMLRCRPPRQPW